MIVSLGMVSLLTVKWGRIQSDEQISYRLNRAVEVLRRIHASASVAGRFQLNI